MPQTQIYYSIMVAFFSFFIVIGLVRNNLLRINFSILWIFVTMILLLCSLKYDWVLIIVRHLGLGDPKNLFFFIMLFFLLAVCVQFSIAVSSLVLKVKNLAQKVALMEYKLNQVNEDHEFISPKKINKGVDHHLEIQ